MLEFGIYLFLFTFFFQICVWGSEDSLGELALSPYRVGYGGQIRVLRLGSKHLYPVTHFVGPRKLGFKSCC